MKKNGWRQIILRCLYNKNQLDLLSELLEETDKCKQLLYNNARGYTGMSLLDMIKELL